MVDLDSDNSSSEDEDEAMPLSPRPPLRSRVTPGNGAATAAAAIKQAPLAFKKLSEPMEIDLTLDDDICCMVRC